MGGIFDADSGTFANRFWNDAVVVDFYRLIEGLMVEGFGYVKGLA